MDLLDDGSSGRQVRRRLAAAPMRRPAAATGNAARIHYASDCNGLDGGALALKALGVPFVHEFGGEFTPAYRREFEHLHPECNTVYSDIMERNFARLKRQHHVNVYTSGFPCQAFSKQGLQLGEADPKGRGLIAFWVLKTIKVMKPSGFILENVSNLATAPNFAGFFEWLIFKLRASGYLVETAVLDSLHYGAVPAARKRVYVIGIKKDKQCTPWTWPEPLPLVPLSAVLEQRLPRQPTANLNMTQLRNLSSGMDVIKHKDPAANWKKDCWVIDLETSESFGPSVSNNRLPTITKARARSGFWLTRQERFTSTTELLRCQGIDPTSITRPETVSEKQLREMIGNGFTVSVFQRLLARLLSTVGLASPINPFDVQP